MIGIAPFSRMTATRLPSGYGGPFYGVYAAVVVDLNDDTGQGRVKVRLPWSPDSNDGAYEAWARVAMLMAGNNRGTWFIPDVDDEVLVGFEAGDPRRPYVLGGLWNGQDAPPQEMDSSGENNVKAIHSRNGVVITLDDSQGEEKLILETPGGQKITLKDGEAGIELLDSAGNTISLASDGVSITSSGNLTVQASQVDVSAGMVSVNAGMSKFSGVIQADTVITNSVVSSSYTPGAGNIW